MIEHTQKSLMNSDEEHLAGLIALSGKLPASWRQLGEPLSDAELVAINDSNAVLLNAIAVVDSQTAGDSDDSGSSSDILRLEAKVDLLLGLVTRVLAVHQSSPALVNVVLSAQHIRWQDGLITEANSIAGEYGLIDLYVYPLIAVPLSLPVRLLTATSAQLVGLNAYTLNGLEKFLFRQHRRAVACARQQKEHS